MEKDKKDKDGILQHFYVSGVEPFKRGKLDVDREIAKENMERYNYERLTHYFNSIFTYISIFLLALIFLFLIWIQYSSVVRWLIIVMVLAILASLILRKIGKESKPINEWRKTSKFKKINTSELEKTSKLVRRAFKGLTTSQALLEERIRDGFIKKMKCERGISDRDVEELLEDPGRLRRYIGDDVITDFLIHCKDYRETGGDKKLFSNMKINKKSDDDYREWIEIVIDGIDKWN